MYDGSFADNSHMIQNNTLLGRVIQDKEKSSMSD